MTQPAVALVIAALVPVGAACSDDGCVDARAEYGTAYTAMEDAMLDVDVKKAPDGTPTTETLQQVETLLTTVERVSIIVEQNASCFTAAERADAESTLRQIERLHDLVNDAA